MIELVALLGAGVGVGVILIVVGVRGVEVDGRLSARPRLRTLPRWFAFAILAGLTVTIATGWPVAGLYAAAAALVVPRVMAQRRAQRGTVSRVEAIAAWAEMLRDAMAGAAGLEGAIVASAPAAPLAIRDDVRQLAADLTRQRIGRALRDFAERLADPTADLVVAALLMAAEHQGRQLGDLLGTLARSARDEAAMRLRVEAGRARIRGDLQIIIITVVGFAAVFLLFNRSYYTPYDTALGQVVLAGIGGIFAAAFWLLVQLGTVAAPPRLLAQGMED